MGLEEKIIAIKEEMNQIKVKSTEELEAFRIKFLGSKNIIKGLYQELRTVPNELKKEFGQRLNALKQAGEAAYDRYKSEVDSGSNGSAQNSTKIDLTRPAEKMQLGTRHPLAVVRAEIIEIFNRIGFTVSEGPEIEDDWHNFSALNFPPEHPARDMQDTFFIEQGENEMALRTHTSSRSGSGNGK